MKTILNAIIDYLKDWKNLLTHSLIGVAILLIALVMPVQPVYKIFILLVVIILNVIRMKNSKK